MGWAAFFVFAAKQKVLAFLFAVLFSAMTHWVSVILFAGCSDSVKGLMFAGLNEEAKIFFGSRWYHCWFHLRSGCICPCIFHVFLLIAWVVPCLRHEFSHSICMPNLMLKGGNESLVFEFASMGLKKHFAGNGFQIAKPFYMCLLPRISVMH